MGTMVPGYGDKPATARDLQHGVAPQVSLGNDEVDVPMDGTDPGTSYEDAPEPSVNAAGEVLDEAHYLRAIDMANSEDTLRFLWEDAREKGALTQAVKSAVLERKAIVDHEAKIAADAAAAEPQPEPAPEAPAAEEPPAEPKATPAKKGSK